LKVSTELATANAKEHWSTLRKILLKKLLLWVWTQKWSKITQSGVFTLQTLQIRNVEIL